MSKRKKSLVGWTRKGWIYNFFWRLDEKITLNLPTIFETKYGLGWDKIKVRITIEEV